MKDDDLLDKIAAIDAMLKKRASARDELSKKYADERNKAPCTVCKGTDFIQLYRNVVGEVSGSMQGNFSLFGGSVTGHISGSTSTLPVLSCSNCHNERTIQTWDYKFENDLFWDDMHEFYFGVDLDWSQETRARRLARFQELPYIKQYGAVATRAYMMTHRNWKYDFYNSMVNWSPRTWAAAGFDIKPVKKKFLWFKWEKWPTWGDLTEEEEDNA